MGSDTINSLELRRSFKGNGDGTHDFNFLLQGKLTKIWLENKLQLKLNLYLPKNVKLFAVGDAPLFDEITLVIEFRKLIVGTLNNDSLTIKLEDNEKVFEVFNERVFLSDFGHPKAHGVEDIEIPTLIDVKFNDSHIDTPSNDLELIIPEGFDMPYVRVVFNRFYLFDKLGNEIKYNEIIENLRIYYEDDFIRTQDRMMCDWEYLFEIKNSLAFYDNHLKQHHWFKHQFHYAYGKPKLSRSFGDLTLPCWVEIESQSIKWDEYDNLIDFKMLTATKRSNELKEGSDYIWIPSEDTFANLTLISNELINCDNDNPFNHAIDLYFSKWLPCDSFSSSLLYDLLYIIDNDTRLSEHPRREEFLPLVETIIEERKLTVV